MGRYKYLGGDGVSNSRNMTSEDEQMGLRMPIENKDMECISWTSSFEMANTNGGYSRSIF